jgi:lipopolysaccharide/colanic/teichoic acid biosynthesis glycosyltransferase
MRRMVDVVTALFLLGAAAPLLGLIAVAVKIGSPGPVLYAPLMVGQGGRPFRLYRFRTMVVDGDGGRGRAFTPVGRLIRSVSLDHLPMLLNLLNGDLTLVGPRPMEPERVDLADPMWQAYLRVRPGLFNYAVLALGRTWTPLRETRPELNQELELEYERRRSAWTDARLVLGWLWGLVKSRGNVKARGEAGRDTGHRP